MWFPKAACDGSDRLSAGRCVRTSKGTLAVGEFVRCGVANGPLWYRVVSFKKVSKEVANRGVYNKKINKNR